jgi:hypothetical protein
VTAEKIATIERAGEPGQTPLAIERCEPNEIDVDSLPAQVSIKGTGFTKNARVRITYIADELFHVDVIPRHATASALAFVIDEKTLTAASKVRQAPTNLRLRQRMPPQALSIRVVAGDRSSNTVGLRVIPSGIRIVVDIKSTHARVDSTLEIPVRVERRHESEEITLRAVAFRPPSSWSAARGIRAGLARQVRGLEGGGHISAGDNGGLVRVQIQSFVPTGPYKLLLFTLPRGISKPNFVGAVDVAVFGRPCWPDCAPTPPWNFMITNVLDHRVHLSFEDWADTEDGFRIERKSAGGNWSIIKNFSPQSGINNLLTYDDSGLTENTQYCYRVVAWNEHGESFSDEICITTQALLDPAGPSGLSVVSVTASTISLRWQDNATNEDDFLVARRAPGGAWSVIATVLKRSGIGSVEWQDSGLLAGTSYCYKIASHNAYGTVWSYEACAQTSAPPPPPPPTRADLAFYGSMWAEPTHFPAPYEPFTIYYYVCNFGDKTTGTFIDVVQRNGGAETTSIPIDFPVEPGECYYGWITYDFGLGAGSHYWYVYLDASGKVSESNEANNTNYLGLTVG